MMADITEKAFGSLVEEQKKTTTGLTNVRSLLKQQTDLQYATTDAQKEELKTNREAKKLREAEYRKNAQDKAKDDSQASKKAEEEGKKGIQNKKMLSFLKKMSVGLTDMGKSLAGKAKSVGGDIWSVLKKMALGAAMLGLIAFLQSPYWPKFTEWVTETLPKLLTLLWDYVLAPIARGLGKITDVLTGKKEWTDLFDWDVIGTITAIAALLFPFKTIKLLGGAAKLFKNALFRSSKKLDTISQEMDPSKDKGKGKDKTKKPRGRGRFGRVLGLGKQLVPSGDTVKKTGSKIASTAKTAGSAVSKTAGAVSKTAGSAVSGVGSKVGGALLKAGPALLRTAAGAAKFIPGIGLGVTAIMGLFDGITAGMKEAEKENSTKMDVVREGFAGALSGLTFGMVDQKIISEGMTKASESLKNMASSVGEGLDLAKDAASKGLEEAKKLAAKGAEEAKKIKDAAVEKAKQLAESAKILAQQGLEEANRLKLAAEEKAKQLAESAKEVAGKVGDKINVGIEATTDAVQGAATAAKEKVEEAMKEGSALLSALGSMFTDTVEAAKRASKKFWEGPGDTIADQMEAAGDDAPTYGTQPEQLDARDQEVIAQRKRRAKKALQKQQFYITGLKRSIKDKEKDVATDSWYETDSQRERDRKRLEQLQKKLAEAELKAGGGGSNVQQNNIDNSNTSNTSTGGPTSMTNRNDAMQMAAQWGM